MASVKGGKWGPISTRFSQVLFLLWVQMAVAPDGEPEHGGRHVGENAIGVDGLRYMWVAAGLSGAVGALAGSWILSPVSEATPAGPTAYTLPGAPRSGEAADQEGQHEARFQKSVQPAQTAGDAGFPETAWPSARP